jgi:hypothetical protein
VEFTAVFPTGMNSQFTTPTRKSKKKEEEEEEEVISMKFC